jgi:hypothetical protein
VRVVLFLLSVVIRVYPCPTCLLTEVKLQSMVFKESEDVGELVIDKYLLMPLLPGLSL